MSLFTWSTHESIFTKHNKQIKLQNIFFERSFKAQQSYTIFSLVVSKFTLKIPMERFAYLITKLYLLCNESCFPELPFLSINHLIENHFELLNKKIFTTCLGSLLQKPVELIFQRKGCKHWDKAKMKRFPLTCHWFVYLYNRYIAPTF